MGAERILILGGGVAGLATAWCLAQRGARDVLLLEREPRLAQHSSRLNAAILRTLTHDPLLSRFARKSAEFLRDPPPGFAPEPVLDTCGLLLCADGRGAQDLLGWARDCALARDWRPLSAEEARAKAPHFDLGTLTSLWFAREGRIHNEALLQAFERGARAKGLAIRTEARIERLLTRDGAIAGVSLEGGEEIAAATVVLAAGGWAGRLGATAGSGLCLRPTKRHLLVTQPDERVAPGWPVVWTAAEPFYARPEAGGLLACALDESAVEPDACACAPEVRQTIEERARRWMPELVLSAAARYSAGMRTFSVDERFCIGWDADVRGLYWVAGLAGHGMTCAYTVGRMAAEALTGACGQSEYVRAFDPARFSPDRRPRPSGLGTG